MAAGSATAQGTGVPAQFPVATLDQETLFLQSAFGKRLQRELEAERDALAAENRRIEAELIAEEQALTDKRKGLAPADFVPLAQAFDQKVEAIRSEQDAKARALQQRLDRERQLFLKQVGPALAEILRSRGALVLIDSNAVLIAAGGIDITDLAIAAIDERIGDGSGLEDGASDGAGGTPEETTPAAPSPGGTMPESTTPGTAAPESPGAGTPMPQLPGGLSLGAPAPAAPSLVVPAAPVEPQPQAPAAGTGGSQ